MGGSTEFDAQADVAHPPGDPPPASVHAEASAASRAIKTRLLTTRFCPKTIF